MTAARPQLATASLTFGVGKMAIPNQIRCPGQTFYYESNRYKVGSEINPALPPPTVKSGYANILMKL